MSTKFKILPATTADAHDMAICYFDAFHGGAHPQVTFYKALITKTPNNIRFFERSLSEQMRRDSNALFLRVVDSDADDKLVGFATWQAPNDPKFYWENFTADMDVGLLDTLFKSTVEHRDAAMAGRPHWYLEMFCISSEYAARGAGKLMMSHALNLADRDGVETYLDASPAAKPLYECFGFQQCSSRPMSAPYEWYVRTGMLRPKKISKT